MWKYEGDGYVPGVPARDLTDEEMEAHIKAGRIVPGSPAARMWKKEREARERKEG